MAPTAARGVLVAWMVSMGAATVRVFVPMPDVWDDPEAFRGVKLVPYRVGMALCPGRVLEPVPAAPEPPPQRDVPPKAA